MAAHEADTSRQLSRVWIHVERVIGRWKNYEILQTIIPISLADILVVIVIVCGGLTNLCRSIVNKKMKHSCPSQLKLNLQISEISGKICVKKGEVLTNNIYVKNGQLDKPCL